MIDLARIFENFFDSKEISDSELLDFANAHVQRMENNNPGGVLTPLITPTKAAAAAFEAGGSATLTKLGVQKARTMTKDEFRAALPAAIAKIYGALVAAFGPNAPEVAECFPEGRKAFQTCKNDDRKQKLQALVDALTPKVPPLAQGVVDQATDLLETWTDIYGAQSAAKSLKIGAATSVQPLRAALELELTKNVLSIAQRYLCDGSKVALYFPQELLRNRANPTTPGVTTLTLAGQDAQPRTAHFTMTADGAESFRLLKCIAGEADMTVVAEGIVPVDGVGSYSIYLEGTATYEFAAEAVRGTRTVERSGIVTVAAN